MALTTEGATRLYLPSPETWRGPGRRRAVFYNAGMALDRDLEVAVGNALAGSGPRVERAWEMTAATGVRGLRLLNESSLLGGLVATESHSAGFRVLERNVALYAAQGATARQHDATRPVERHAFDLVDLDPYGSPAPFLNSALDAVSERGLLAVTATDLRVLAGVEHGAAERRYGGVPVRGRLGPEAGLRLLLAWTDREARSRGQEIVPLLAYVRDHHVRAYLRFRPAGSADPPVGLIDPATWPGPPLPPAHRYGPLWLGPLFDAPLTRALRVPPGAAHPRSLERFIERLQGELVADRPFYYESNSLAEGLGLREPPRVDRLLEELRRSGHAAARTHAREGAFRTSASRQEVEAIARQLART